MLEKGDFEVPTINKLGQKLYLALRSYAPGCISKRIVAALCTWQLLVAIRVVPVGLKMHILWCSISADNGLMSKAIGVFSGAVPVLAQ